MSHKKKKKKKKEQNSPKRDGSVFLKCVTPDDLVSMAMRAHGSTEIEEWFTENGLRILVSTEPTVHGDLRHVSVSRKDRHPSWDEIKAIRDKFLPKDKAAMMVLPTAEFYVNVHEHTFHIWESPIEWKIR